MRFREVGKEVVSVSLYANSVFVKPSTLIERFDF